MTNARSSSLFLALTCTLLVAGCESQKPQQQYVAPTTAKPVAGGNASQATRTNNRFAWDLWSKTGSISGEDNFFISPVALSQALSMTAIGTEGDTTKQIREAMGMGSTNTWLSDQRTLVESLNKSQTAGTAFYSANAIWVHKDEVIKNDYLQTMETYFHSQIQYLDFSDTTSASDTINAWNDSKTNSVLHSRVANTDLKADTRILATSTAFFRGDWATEFDKRSTDKQSFRLANGQTISVNTMHAQFRAPYAEDDTFQFVELPFKGKRFVFRAMLPKEGQSLPPNEERISALAGKMKPTLVTVNMPQFVAHWSGDLIRPLKALGIKHAFEGGDFSPTFYDTDKSKSNLGGMYHATYASFGETGVESAKANNPAAPTGAVNAGVLFNVNRPFAYQVFDLETNTILFMGRLNDPTK